MELINIALDQIKKKSTPEQIFDRYDFFKEYFKVFNHNDKFTEDTIQSLKEMNINDILDTSHVLEEKVQEKIEKITKDIELEVLPGMITFIGDESFDGHGIILNGKPYVFFDLTAVTRRKDKYNLDMYVTHELIHSIHYGSQVSFYPGKYKNIKDKYLKRLIAEGLATFLANYYNNYNIEDSYWLGFLDSDKVREWIINCENNKNKIGDKLKVQINRNEFDENLYLQLFALPGSDYANGRCGYYYGSQIVEEAFQDKTVKELLGMKFYKFEKYIELYFNW